MQQRLGDSVARVEINADADFLSDDNTDEMLLKGAVDIAASPINLMQKYNSRFKLFDLPFLFVTPDAAYKFVQGEYGSRLNRLISQHGFEGFGFLNIGMKQFSADDLIKLPRDFRNLRMNIIGDEVVEAGAKALRTTHTTASNPQLYDLLKAKEVDALENTWTAIFDNKFYEVQPYMIESNHAYLGYIVLSSKAFWDKVPADIKPIVKQSLVDAINLGNAIALENEQADRLNVIATKKTEIHEMTVTERRQWINVVQPIWKDYENEIGSELISAAASVR